jgi:ParB family chromosome partitioning protein
VQRSAALTLKPKEREPVMTITMIPLSKLIPSAVNVRKTGATAGIAELAASIKAHGLLQNLQVRPAEGGKFEVVAGRRRLAALKRLARNKDIEKLVEIPCQIIEEGDAAEISLAENVVRLPMHPADQFDAFRGLAETGKGPEEIAARFGCTPATVRQRLKLASVSPRLMKIYRAGKMDLDQLMAFAISDDHAAQETAWFKQPEWNRDPATVRRVLTSAHVEASDRRARFVGIEAYTAAGGHILRDLFAEAHEGYLTDPALLDQLAVERLEREAETIRAEGWKWVEITPDLDYAAFRGFGRVHPQVPPLDTEQQAEFDRLSAAYDALAEEHGEDVPEPVAAEMETLANQIGALSQRQRCWRPEDIARAGAIIGIGHAGRLAVERGLVRPEDVAEAGEVGETVRGERRSGTANRQSGDLSAALIEDLTAQRTAALRTMLADNPDVALAAVVHAMALPLFYDRFGAKSCLWLQLETTDLRGTTEGIEDAPAMRALAEHHAQWSRRLPEADDELWAWCLGQDTDARLTLLAYCAACSVDAVRKPNHPADAQLAHADQLATALSLDMTQWWQPTAGNYLGRVSKQRILEAVAEGVSPEAAENLSKLKKDALVAHAEQRLAGTGWLPVLLRSPSSVADEQPAVAAE